MTTNTNKNDKTLDNAVHLRTYIGGIERGERHVSFANLLKIADALDEHPSKLLAHYEVCFEHRCFG